MALNNTRINVNQYIKCQLLKFKATTKHYNLVIHNSDLHIMIFYIVIESKVFEGKKMNEGGNVRTCNVMVS